jgi:hypothetical protein
MGIEVTPELGIELPASTPYLDLHERALAVCKAAEELMEHGAEIGEVEPEELNAITAITNAYAEDPKKTSRTVSPSRTAELSPASMIMVGNILNEFGHLVVENSVRIRNLVTNKLLLESENDDPRIRLRALELLGKISDVGLFTEKQEITVTHKSTDELRESLRSKLSKIVEGDVIEDAVIIDGEQADVAEEFGLDEYFDDE